MTLRARFASFVRTLSLSLSVSDRIRGFVAACCVIFAAGAMCAGQRMNDDAPLREPGAPTREQILDRLKEAGQADDLPALCAAIEDLYDVDPRRAHAMTQRLIERGSPSWRCAGVSLAARLAAPKDVAALARRMHRSRHRDERRWLVRALGSRAAAIVEDGTSAEEVRDLEALCSLLRDFLQDSDDLVRAAAIAAMSDAKMPVHAIRMFRDLPPAPSPGQQWEGQETDQDVLTLSMYGAMRSLMGIRAESSSMLRTYLREAIAACPDIRAGETVPEALRRLGKANDPVSEYFEVRFHAMGGATMEDFDAEQVGFARRCDAAAEAAIAAAAPIFGRAHLPALRLMVFEDANALGTLGIPTTGFNGVSKGNTIGIVTQDGLDNTMSTLTHEYVHVIHNAHYTNQPRWLMEGVAESLSESATQSAWRHRPARRDDLDRLFGRGLNERLFSWTSGGVAGGDEKDRYDLAHLFIDWLRFSGFAEPEARLAFFMGEIARGSTPATAFERFYAMSVKEADAAIRAWVEAELSGS